jgi:hypothetical protein
MLQALLQARGDDRIGEAVAAYRRHHGESDLSEASLTLESAAPRNATSWIANIFSHIEA